MFDMGGTLEAVHYDDEMRLNATLGFRDILAKHDLNPGLAIPELYAVIKNGMLKYQAWRVESQKELPPEQLWSTFVFTNDGLAKDKIAAIGEDLAFYWDTQFFKRELRPNVPAMLAALHERGFRLGVISNTTSRSEVPHKLAEYGIAQYFDVVLMSAEFGWRKPNPRIFHEAAHLMNVPPAACAYVGDTISRDVIGARRAGYAMVIQIKSFLTTQVDSSADTEQPDAVVQNLMQVVDLVANKRGNIK
jgi:putative hydrolase of the HAD superfamily